MTNFEFACEIEKSVKNDLINKTKSDLECQYINKIFESCLIITPLQNENAFIKIKMDPSENDSVGVSRKLQNVKLNLKDAIIIATDILSAYNVDIGSYKLILIALNALIRLYSLSSVKLDTNDCELVLYLHNHNAYTSSIPEEKIIEDIKKGVLTINESSYFSSLKRLVKISAVVVINGEISLKERIKLDY